MNNTKTNFTNSLLNILQLDIIGTLKQFIEGEIGILFLLYRKGISLSPKQISIEQSISKGRVAVLINSLIDKEYVEVSISTKDRRSFNVSLSIKGKSFLVDKMNYADDYFTKMIIKIGDDRTNTLTNLLDEIVDLMKEE